MGLSFSRPILVFLISYSDSRTLLPRLSFCDSTSVTLLPKASANPRIPVFLV